MKDPPLCWMNGKDSYNWIFPKPFNKSSERRRMRRQQDFYIKGRDELSLARFTADENAKQI